MGILTMDIGSLKKDLKSEEVQKYIDFLDSTIVRAKSYSKLAGEIGIKAITPHQLWGDFVSYRSVKDSLKMLLEREDLTSKQRLGLEGTLDFWASEELTLRGGFYGERKYFKEIRPDLR